MKLFGKKANHFEKNKKSRDDRQVLSFEQLPLEDYDEQQSSEKKPLKLDKRKLIVAVSVLLILVLSVLVYFSTDSISCTGSIGDGNFALEISGSDVDTGNFRVFSQGLCYASDTGFTYLDSKGEEMFSTQLGYASPMLETKGNAAIVYDLGGKGYTVCSDYKVERSAEAKDNIYLADITADFSYALLTETSGYNARLEVYSPENTIKYAYNFSEYYVTSMALKNDASGAVVCGVSADKGTRVSAVYVLDFTKEEPVAKHIISDDLVFDCDYLAGNSVCAIGESGAYICNGRGFGTLNKKSYNQMTLTAYDMNCDVGVLTLSLSRSGDGRNCSIEYINSSSDTEKTIETDVSIISVSTYKDRIAVSDSSSVYIYRASGELVGSKEIATDCKQVRMHSVNGVYMLGLDGIFALSL